MDHLTNNFTHSHTTHSESEFYPPAPLGTQKTKTKMFSPSHLKTLYPLSVKPSSSSSSSSSSSNLSCNNMKLKRVIHTLLVSHLCRIIRALSKLKSLILEILRDNNQTIKNIHFPYYPSQKKRNSSIRKKIILGSFRLHYNWCSSKSSHVLPVPEPVYEGLFDDSANSEDCPDSQLAGYLQWLEEEKKKKVQEEGDANGNIKGTKEEEEINEIDMLAEMFIANCHEKFRLEKQESDRRFQEMLARSM